MSIALIIGLAVVGILVIWLIATYNRMRVSTNRIDNSWSQIDVQLKRRYDLIPNLVETVKGYASHERETFENVTAARAQGIQAQSVGEQAQAENVLTSALRQLFAVAEAYPQLQANENFQQLQQELTATEGQIAVSRQIYNDTVLSFNNAIQTFPAVLLAGPFGFYRREYLEIEERSREPVQVDFRDMPGRGAEPAGGQPPGGPPTA